MSVTPKNGTACLTFALMRRTSPRSTLPLTAAHHPRDSHSSAHAAQPPQTRAGDTAAAPHHSPREPPAPRASLRHLGPTRAPHRTNRSPFRAGEMPALPQDLGFPLQAGYFAPQETQPPPARLVPRRQSVQPPIRASRHPPLASSPRATIARFP